MSGRVGRAAGLPLVVTPRVGLPLVVPPLPPGATMALWPLAAVTEGSEPGLPLYVSAGKWLHPLFDLLELLSSEGPESGSEERATLAAAGELFLRDRVIGRAAAFLILRAGISRAWADVVSDGAMALLATRGASLGAGELVPAIACRTESFLRDVDDPDIAWALLQQRREGLAAG